MQPDSPGKITSVDYRAERCLPVRLLACPLVTAGACFTFLSVVPTILCMALVVEGGDAGGPLFLPIFIMATIFFAGLSTISLGAVALVADVLRRRGGRLLWWPAVVIFLLGAGMGGLLGGVTKPLLPVVTGGLAVVAYFTYWKAASLLARLVGVRSSGVS
jgi:hypothetical protein